MSGFDIKSDFAELIRHWDALQEILGNEAYCAVKDESVSGWDCGEHAGHIAYRGYSGCRLMPPLSSSSFHHRIHTPPY
ncbi:MAG: hypothetical protein COA73_12450 [Candidatus Hydrogenedentota bacterium]|nr:MAG: hypothetical protein COA73_12450 [Candidatus Hydrogenedentota bacterium]